MRYILQKQTGNKRSYIQQHERKIKALHSSKRTGNRCVVFNKNEREIEALHLTNTTGK